MNRRSFTSVLFVTFLLAGCVGGNAPADPADRQAVPEPDVASTTPAETSGDARPPAQAVLLHLDVDGGFTPDVPAAGWRTIDDAVHSPVTTTDDHYPTWIGMLPVPAELTGGHMQVTVHLASSSASLQANTVPVFDVSGVYAILWVGEERYYAGADGPTTLVAGEVATVVLELEGTSMRAEAGTPLWLRIEPLYTSAMTAAELRVLVGGDHPTSLAIAAPP